MAKIMGFRVKNFKVLKDVTLGKLRDDKKARPLTPITAVIGKNGVGKSSLFDAFGFLSDCLKFGVEEACDIRGRGGYNKVRSLGSNGNIEFEVSYIEDNILPPIFYKLVISLDESTRCYVSHESVSHQFISEGKRVEIAYLQLDNASGSVTVINDDINDRLSSANGKQSAIKQIYNALSIIAQNTQFVTLEDKRRLGITTLGALKQHPRISAFRNFLEGWHLSYFTPDAARSMPMAGAQKHLNVHGDNLGNVVQYMEREHPKEFQSILNRIAQKIPGIRTIKTLKSPDGRLLLCFNDHGFQDPFYAQQMSDGTLKLFAYMLLLEDPTPPPFICIEEPENGLYHKLLETLADEFRAHTERKNGSQIFVTTHQPYFVNSLKPDEVWVLSKGNDGFAKITRASDDKRIVDMACEGIQLGNLWYSDYFDPR